MLSGFFKICLIFRKSLSSRVKFFYFLKKFINPFNFNHLLDFLKQFDFSGTSFLMISETVRFLSLYQQKIIFSKNLFNPLQIKSSQIFKICVSFSLFLYQQKIIFFLNPLQAMVNKHLTELLWNRLAFMTHSLPILTENTFL